MIAGRFVQGRTAAAKKKQGKASLPCHGRNIARFNLYCKEKMKKAARISIIHNSAGVTRDFDSISYAFDLPQAIPGRLAPLLNR